MPLLSQRVTPTLETCQPPNIIIFRLLDLNEQIPCLYPEEIKAQALHSFLDVFGKSRNN